MQAENYDLSLTVLQYGNSYNNASI